MEIEKVDLKKYIDEMIRAGVLEKVEKQYMIRNDMIHEVSDEMVKLAMNIPRDDILEHKLFSAAVLIVLSRKLGLSKSTASNLYRKGGNLLQELDTKKIICYEDLINYVLIFETFGRMSMDEINNEIYKGLIGDRK